MELKEVLPREVKEGWTISSVLSRQAKERPDSPSLQWQTEEPFSYKELYEHCLRLAGGIKELGIQPGDRVLIMLPNSMEIVLTWFGVNLLGAVEVPINIHYKESWLVHEVNDCEARLAIVHEQYLQRFVQVADQLEHLTAFVVVGGDVPAARQVTEEKWSMHTWGELENAEAIDEPVETYYHETSAIMYTSGTTGPSKGVVLPYGVGGVFAQGVIDAAELTSDDVNYVVHPLFHANAQFMQVLPSLLVGGRISLWPGFSGSRWLEQVRACGATITNTLGVMCNFIYGQPERENDADNPLRVMITLPAPSDIAEDFERRFALKCVEGYGMTEVGVITYRRLNEPLRLGSAGRAMEWCDVRIVDPETDEPLPPGNVGEIVMRPKTEGIMMKEYNNVPAKTVEAWRNLWFHAGDAGKMDEEGYLYFADRVKDVIRRRGENISSFSIESVADAHPSVQEAAAIAVPAEQGVGAEDEVMLCVILEQGAELEPAELHEYCAQRMPYFAVPRYIEYVLEIPKTANEKVRKNVLRERGVTPDTWDREAAGIQLQK
ncbi:MAG: AMP-binding protein [Rubrobacteraceae bacterium]|jgi:crotonobetaine/carnitine-CoA ligase